MSSATESRELHKVSTTFDRQHRAHVYYYFLGAVSRQWVTQPRNPINGYVMRIIDQNVGKKWNCKIQRAIQKIKIREKRNEMCGSIEIGWKYQQTCEKANCEAFSGQSTIRYNASRRRRTHHSRCYVYFIFLIFFF